MINIKLIPLIIACVIMDDHPICGIIILLTAFGLTL
jgi:hypothetical protein